MQSLIPTTHVAAVASFLKAASRAARKAALFLFSVAVLLAGGGAAARGQSALDGFDPNANGLVRVVVVQPDGKILIGGDFTSLSPNGGAAVTRNRIARLNPDGTLDIAFDPNANALVLAIAVQGDGKVLVGGAFTNIGGQARTGLARLDATTGLADSFDSNANGSVRTIAVQADGKILVGGGFSGTNSIGGQPRNRIARLDPTTGLADSFNPNPNSIVFSIAVQPDGKVLVGGVFFGANSIGGQARNFIARLDATTGLADSFNPTSNELVRSIVVQPDGKILVGGEFNTIGGQTRNFIARLDATSGLADSFDPNAGNLVFSLALQADGKILAGGFFTTLAPNGQAAVTRNRIARLERDGTLDQTLDLSTVGSTILATTVQPDGKILIGGNFTNVLGVARNRIARLNTDGTLDTDFNPNATGDVYAIAMQADGRILAGGAFNGVNSIGGQTRNYIARLDATTGLADSSFNPDANGAVRSIAVQADGKILAGGEFNGANSIGAQTRNFIARLDATGLADSFNPDATGEVESIAVQTDGKILAGGAFTGIGGQTRSAIARLDATSGAADLFNPNANNTVGSIAVQADGKILAGGIFTNIGGQTRNRLARLDAITGAADSFDPNANGFVFAVAVQADGKILASGQFTSIGGQTRNFIARLNTTTAAADPFDPNANAPVRSIAVQADGKILAGGFFTSIGGQPRSLFARLSNDAAALQNLAVTQDTTTWTLGGSSPQFTRVTFEYSNDNVNYFLLGNGTASGSTWTRTGLSLTTGTNFYIRARGYYRSGWNDGSESLTESVRNAFLAGPTAADATISGQILASDSTAIPGAIVHLTGTQTRKTITDASGNYRFDNVETNGFYTVTPSRANYSFGPVSRSFSQLGNTTEAVFTGIPNAVIVGNAIDTAEYFVRQHYLDFLGREPDEAGFNFWSDQMLECGADAGCLERRRINVSAAYFLSIEFQQTGGLVDGLYRASYGRRPFYVEFLPDSSAIAHGVVVGRNGWEQLLETNKQAFVDAWVQRAAFVGAYGNLSDDDYVDQLLAHTGVNYTTSERAALVVGLTNATLTRAAALRQIVENDSFGRAKFNQTFVMMQYFGYLRRDPDESGYEFWLRKLNQFDGDFEQAEMVKAFIVSSEYRTRFPQ